MDLTNEKFDDIYEVDANGLYLGIDLEKNAEFRAHIPYPQYAGEMFKWDFDNTEWVRIFGYDSLGMHIQYLTDPFQATGVTTQDPWENGNVWNFETEEWTIPDLPKDPIIQTVEIDGSVSRTGIDGSTSEADTLKAEILADFPTTDLTNGHNFSKTENNVHYSEDVISVYFTGGLPQDIIDEFQVSPVKETFMPSWGMKFMMGSKTRKIKIIDQAYEDYPQIALPVNAVNMGVTIQYDGNGLVDEMDVYFAAMPDKVDVYNELSPVPGHSISENRNMGLYGITYKPSTGELIKIKRYFMELVPGMKFE